MFLRHKKYEEEITMYTLPEVRKSGGTRDAFDSITQYDVRAFVVKFDTEFVRDEYGTSLVENLIVQVSKRNIEEAGITLESGSTFFLYKGNEYRVMNVLDYTDYGRFQLYQLDAVRTIDDY